MSNAPQAPATKTARGLSWLGAAAGFCVLLAAVTVALGWDREFWYDEVYTLGAAAIGRPLNWEPILFDVHPPTHVLLVRLAGWLTGAADPALRLTNLPGLAALAGGLLVLSRSIGRDRLLLLVVLLVCNLYALNLGLDLRAYFMLLGFGTLGHALLHAEGADGRPRSAGLAATATVLGALHFFGTALGCALLSVSAWRHLRAGRRLRAALLMLSAGGIAALVLGYAFTLSDTRLQLGGGKTWITNGPDPYLDFLGWTLPLGLIVLLIVVWRRRGAERTPRPAAATTALVPPAMVLAAALLISLHTPVISTRNLIVCLPGAALAAALVCPPGLLARLRASPLVLAAVALIGLRYADTATRGPQMIRWVVETATPPACDGVPLYVARPDRVDVMAQEVFLGELRRPPADFFDFDSDAPWPADCPFLGAGFHEYGAVADVTAFFAMKGVATEALLPPDPRLARTGLMTHGFVIRRLD